MGVGWNKKRWVIRAIERYFDNGFNEKEDFTEFRNGWLIKHYDNCNVFTILEKINQLNTQNLNKPYKSTLLL